MLIAIPDPYPERNLLAIQAPKLGSFIASGTWDAKRLGSKRIRRKIVLRAHTLLRIPSDGRDGPDHDLPFPGSASGYDSPRGGTNDRLTKWVVLIAGNVLCAGSPIPIKDKLRQAVNRRKALTKFPLKSSWGYTLGYNRKGARPRLNGQRCGRRAAGGWVPPAYQSRTVRVEAFERSRLLKPFARRMTARSNARTIFAYQSRGAPTLFHRN